MFLACGELAPCADFAPLWRKQFRCPTAALRCPHDRQRSPRRRIASAASSSPGPGHGGSGASCSRRIAAPAAAHAVEDAGDGSPRTPSAAPGTTAIASTGGSRQSTAEVGTGGSAIAAPRHRHQHRHRHRHRHAKGRRRPSGRRLPRPASRAGGVRRPRPLPYRPSGRSGESWRYRRSMMVAFAMPPPSHMVCRP